MLRQRLSDSSARNRFEYAPVRKSSQAQKYVLSEWKIATYGLIFSLLILLGKIYYSNREYLHNLLLEQKYVSYESITSDGQVMFSYSWKTAVRYSKYWFPAVCGVLTTYFTWLMVYLDSSVPGVQPPSPFSPTKYKVQSGHTFHLNYIFAVVIGFCVSAYLYWRGAQI